MKYKIIIWSIIGVFLAGLVVAQVFNLPNSFTVNPNWNILPQPQENQRLFGCKYAFPIELRDIEVYNYNVLEGNLNLNASFSLYTGNKTSTCRVKARVITVNLASWQNSLASYITTSASSNITTHNPSGSTTISIGGQG